MICPSDVWHGMPQPREDPAGLLLMHASLALACHIAFAAKSE
jgi:hypothetical protein